MVQFPLLAMRILCVSDQIDPLIYNSAAAKNFPDIDLILCAGDLPMDYVDFIVTTFNKPAYFVFGNHDLKELDAPAAHGAVCLDRKVVSLPRIICDKTMTKVAMTLSNGVAMGVEVGTVTKKLDTPLIIAGVSGSMRYNNGRCQYTDAQMFFRLLWMVPKLLLNKIRYGKYLDIFLTHATPKGIHDKRDLCHAGFGCFNWFIRRFKPKLMVHGHIHLYDTREERSGKYFDTFIVNAYAHCVIEM